MKPARRTRIRIVVISGRRMAAALFLAAFFAGVFAARPDQRGSPVTAPAQSGVFPQLRIDRPVREVPPAGKVMALTVNVDWGNDELVEMLDILDRYQVKATFFLTGRWARSFPELAREIASRGHEIGNHGLSHAHPTRLGREELVELIQGNVDVLKEAAGVTPVPLFAPPYGEQDARVVRTAAELGHWTTLWTLDTIDWQNPPPDTIVARVVPRARDGAIVLMHPKPQTVAALARIITGLQEKGYRLVPLWRMMQAQTP